MVAVSRSRLHLSHQRSRALGGQEAAEQLVMSKECLHPREAKARRERRRCGRPWWVDCKRPQIVQVCLRVGPSDDLHVWVAWDHSGWDQVGWDLGVGGIKWGGIWGWVGSSGVEWEEK